MRLRRKAPIERLATAVMYGLIGIKPTARLGKSEIVAGDIATLAVSLIAACPVCGSKKWAKTKDKCPLCELARSLSAKNAADYGDPKGGGKCVR